MRRSVAATALALVAALLTWRCELGGDTLHPDPSRPPDLLGGGSQTETLTGVVVAESGARLPGVRVKLFPSGYDPSLPDTTLPRVATTDDSGRFTFDRLDTAAYYNVVAGLPDQRVWAFADSLKTWPGAPPLALASATTFRIDLHSSVYSARDSGIAFFPGTDILVRCEGVTAVVDSVPQGLHRMVLRSRAGWQHVAQVPTNGDTIAVRAYRDAVQIQYRPD